MLKNSKFLLGVMVVAILFMGAFTLTQKANAAPQAIVTVADIQYAATVKLGSSGQAALIWQRFLNGYSVTANLVEDGAFGPLSTVQAKAWQASRGLVADGVMGPMSRAAAMAQIVSGTPASAFPAGCTSTVGFSSVTGFSCAPVTYPAGCLSAAGFSPTTGLSCAGVVVVINLPAGCSTTAGFSPTTGASCAGTGVVVVGTGLLVGGAGDAILTHFATSEKSQIKEGDSDVKVLGFRVEAQDSDIALQNVKVSIDNTNNNSSYRLERYVDSVDVYMGSTKVGSADVADFTKSSTNVYSKSIALSNAVVKNGDKVPFYVVFNAASSIDAANNSASLTVTLESYRFQDATGVIMTNTPDDTVNNIVAIDTTTDALSLLSSSINPDSSTITVLENDTTDEVLALAFKLKAGSNSSDITLDTLPITVKIVGAGASITSSTNVIDSVVVKIGSKTITADETNTSISNDGTNTATYTADFSGEDVVISAGETIEAKVYITFAEQSGNYADGLTIVTASMVGTEITAESNNDDTITSSTTKTGAALTLNTSAAQVSAMSWTTSTVVGAGSLDFYFTVNSDNNFDVLASELADTISTGTFEAPANCNPLVCSVSTKGTLTKISGDAVDTIGAGVGFTVLAGGTSRFQLHYGTITAGTKAITITSVAGQAVPSDTQYKSILVGA